VSDDLARPWLHVRAEVRRAVPESTWHLWLEPLRLRRIDGALLVVEAAADKRDWIEQRFGRLLRTCAAVVIGPEARVELVAEGDAEPSAGAPRTLPAGLAAGVPLNPRLTFDQFVIGDANRFAHAAALAVAEMPGLAYNPLFVCGPPGVGKSHLLQAIGNYVSEHGEGSVRLTTAEAFTNHFVGSLRGGGMDVFMAAYRDVDVLLVDDVQFLQSKARTEEEFFHTFNALHAAGAQLVLTSDRLPRDMEALEQRLRERFEAGLVTDVAAPDFTTRLTILRKRIAQDDVGDIEDEALAVVARRVHANVRALEGALIRVVAFGSLTGRPVDAGLVDEVLAGLYPELRPRAFTVGEIQAHTAAAFGVSIDDLVSARRTAKVAWARQVAMYLARELTEQTLPAIGRAFGGRNHTTVLHAYRRTVERMSSDRADYDAVHKLTSELRDPR
jgi:chromosomal replication initiator protein